MAFFQPDHVFSDSLRPPARAAHDSQSCAITRGSVPNDNGPLIHLTLMSQDHHHHFTSLCGDGRMPVTRIPNADDDFL